MGDSNTLVTSLELRLAGVEASVSGMNRVAAASHNVGRVSGEADVHLARFAGRMTGVGRENFMGLSGILGLFESAGAGWKNFLSVVGETAVFGAAAAGIASVIHVVEELKKTTEDYNKAVEETRTGQEVSPLAMFGKAWLYGATGGWMDPIFGGSFHGMGMDEMGGDTAKRKRGLSGADLSAATMKDVIRQMKPDSWEDKLARWAKANPGVHRDEMASVAASLKAEDEISKRHDTGKSIFADLAQGGSVQAYKDIINWQNHDQQSRNTSEKLLSQAELTNKYLADIAKKSEPVMVKIP